MYHKRQRVNEQFVSSKDSALWGNTSRNLSDAKLRNALLAFGTLHCICTSVNWMAAKIYGMFGKYARNAALKEAIPQFNVSTTYEKLKTFAKRLVFSYVFFNISQHLAGLDHTIQTRKSIRYFLTILHIREELAVVQTSVCFGAT